MYIWNGKIFTNTWNKSSLPPPIPGTPFQISHTILGTSDEDGDAYIADGAGFPLSDIVTLLTTDSITEIIDKLAPLTTADYIISTPAEDTLLITAKAIGNSWRFASLENSTVPYTYDRLSNGTYPGGKMREWGLWFIGGPATAPGTISLYFNSATAVEVAIDGTETEADIVAAIIGATPVGFLSEDAYNLGIAVAITNTTASANAIPISLDPGTTGTTFELVNYEFGV
jgi:hypothetical protein